MKTKKHYFGSIVLTIMIIIAIPTFANETNAIKAIFEQKYRECQEWEKAHFFSSVSGVGKPYADIMRLGPQVLPYIIEKMEEKPGLAYQLKFTCSLITEKCFEKNMWPPGKLGDAHTKAKMFVKWWRHDRKQTPQQFEK